MGVMMAIKDLQARQGKVDITLDVTEVGSVREFEKFGKTGRVANAKAKDDTGEITLTLWNEQVDQVKAGSKVQIKNGYVGEWQGELQLSTGKFGTLEVVEGSGETPPEEPAPEPQQAEETASTSEPEEPNVEEIDFK